MKTFKIFKFILVANLVFSFAYITFYLKVTKNIETKEENIETKLFVKPSIDLSNIEILSRQKGLGEPCLIRKIWEKHKISNETRHKAYYFNNNPLPVWKDSIYFEWNNSRIRTNSDNMMWDRIRPLRELIEVECIEYEGKYLKKIEEYLIEISTQPSWV